ncbi:MAG: winged helix-turn-helix domain-containing protein [Nitrospirota bacterium]
MTEGDKAFAKIMATVRLRRKHRGHAAQYRRRAQVRAAQKRFFIAALATSPPPLPPGETYITLQDFHRMVRRLTGFSCTLRSLRRWAEAGRLPRGIATFLPNCPVGSNFWVCSIEGNGGTQSKKWVVPVSYLHPVLLDHARVLNVVTVTREYTGSREQRLEQYIKDRCEQPLSYRQVATELGLNWRTAKRIIQRLVERGVVTIIKVSKLGFEAYWHAPQTQPKEELA